MENVQLTVEELIEKFYSYPKFLRPEYGVLLMDGKDVDGTKLLTNGFNRPILIASVKGLGMTVPPSTFDISNLLDFITPTSFIKLFDSAKREDRKMRMKTLVRRFQDPASRVDPQVANLLNQDLFSADGIKDVISIPKFITDVDYFPKYCYNKPGITENLIALGVIISEKCSFTNFHIDLAGTTSWIYIHSGTKIVYFMPPTSPNFQALNQFYKQGGMSFLPDKIQECYRCFVNSGQLIVIPSGWIHAVITPEDTIAFGGSAMHVLNLGIQIQGAYMDALHHDGNKFPGFYLCQFRCLQWMRNNLLKVPYTHISVRRGIREFLEAIPFWIAMNKMEQGTAAEYLTFRDDVEILLAQTEAKTATSGVQFCPFCEIGYTSPGSFKSHKSRSQQTSTSVEKKSCGRKQEMKGIFCQWCSFVALQKTKRDKHERGKNCNCLYSKYMLSAIEPDR